VTDLVYRCADRFAELFFMCIVFLGLVNSMTDVLNCLKDVLNCLTDVMNCLTDVLNCLPDVLNCLTDKKVFINFSNIFSKMPRTVSN